MAISSRLPWLTPRRVALMLLGDRLVGNGCACTARTGRRAPPPSTQGEVPLWP
jgi:hypothetical protein